MLIKSCFESCISWSDSAQVGGGNVSCGNFMLIIPCWQKLFMIEMFVSIYVHSRVEYIQKKSNKEQDSLTGILATKELYSNNPISSHV